MKSYGNPDADDVESFINLSQVLTLFTLRKSENNLSDGNSQGLPACCCKTFEETEWHGTGFHSVRPKKFFQRAHALDTCKA